MKDLAGSVMQLLTLGIGIGIGLLISPRLQVATAQQDEQKASTAPNAAVTSSVDPYKPAPITPALSVPSVGANLILVHQLEADRIIVNGYDLLKIDQGILEYLAQQPLANQFAVTSIVSNSRATDIHTIASAQQRPITQTPK